MREVLTDPGSNSSVKNVRILPQLVQEKGDSVTTAIAVIGANYGDEGKGATTNFLAKQKNASTVVRFNGGPQAGHTVQIKNGRRHVFRTYGSGSFQGAQTCIPDTALFNPYEALLEKQAVAKMGFGLPILAVEHNTQIITPWDIALNRFLERGRGESKHGSCGMGIGETERRRVTSEAPKLTAHDLKDPLRIFSFSQEIRKWFKSRLKEESEKGSFTYLSDDARKAMYMMLEVPSAAMARIYEYTAAMLNFDIQPLSHIVGLTDTVIFEGAQGLLLDENDPDHQPYTTWSSTGLDNVVKLCNRYGFKLTEVYYVTRPYLTRHGAGPILAGTECENIWGRDKTNVENEFQGDFRYAHLDIELLNRRIKKDVEKAKEFNPQVFVAVTCLDQIENHERFQMHETTNSGILKIDIPSDDYLSELRSAIKFPIIPIDGLNG